MTIIKHGKHQKLVRRDLEGELNEHILLWSYLEFRVGLILTNFVKIEQFLWPLMAIFIQYVLIIVDPLVVLKIDFSGNTFVGHSDAPEALVVDIQVHFWINIWEHLSLVHNNWNNSVVKFLVY